MSARNPNSHYRISRLLNRLRRLSGNVAPRSFPAGQLEFLPEGALFFEKLFKAISSAASTVCLEYYTIKADQTGQKLADILKEACYRGVRVYLIYDYIGCIDTPESYFRSLRQAGVDCLVFNPLSFKRGLHLFDRRDHRKLSIIDGYTAFLGGRNIGNEYADVAGSQPLFYDTGFSLCGPAVAYLCRLFSESWELEKGQPPEGLHKTPPNAQYTFWADQEETITLISGGPHQQRSIIRSAFRVAMATATEELLIVNPYFLPGPLILRSLLKAARRGVRVCLLLPEESDVPLIRLLSRSTFDQLLGAGIEIYEMKHQLLHAKLMLIDGKRAIIGSANLDHRSFHRNYEINAHIHSESFSGQIRSHLEHDFRQAVRITPDDHNRRSIAARLLERLLRPLCWFL